MPIPIKKEELCTFADLLTWEERAELIDGEVFLMAPPSSVHQKILTELLRQLANFLDGKPCEVYPAPFAVNLNADDKIWVEPDISVICDKDKLSDRGCKGAPDWIIEVVSPASRRIDYTTKLFKYRSAGVREYWIVDADKTRVMVYNFYQDDMSEYSFTEDIPTGIYTDLSIRMSNLEL